MKLKTTLPLLFLVFLSLFYPQQATALAKFSTDFQVNYQVYPTGITHVRYEINQKNNLSVVYATEYSLNINHTKISNVRVVDEGAPLIPEITKTRSGSIIQFAFINKVVGKDKNHKFTIEYDTEDVATKNGNTWELNIPNLSTDENTNSISIILNLPPNFPKPAYINPKPTTIVNNNYLFSGSNLSNKPISAVFGLEQFFKISLNYFLENTGSVTQKKTIALPPDTNYQHIFIESIDPMPEKIYIDEDGNWLADYDIKSQSNLTIKASLIARVTFIPSPKTLNNPEMYTQANELWNFQDPIFTMPEIEALTSPKQIYDYVVGKLDYDFNKAINLRNVAIPSSESLKNSKTAVCTDFTNVFISIARKKGIPTRELQGYALSINSDLKPLIKDQDILHAWPEYYDSAKNTWIQIDPTWSKTTMGIDYFNKLDFNHLVFVIHGLKPYEPLTPGAYKNPKNKTKDVVVEAIGSVDFPTTHASLSSIKRVEDNLILEFENKSMTAFFGSIQIPESDYYSSTNQKIYIPPLGSTTIELFLNKPFNISDKSIDTIITIDGKDIPTRVSIPPKVNAISIFAIGSGVVIAASILAWSLLIRRRK